MFRFAFLVHIVWFIYVVLPISSGPGSRIGIFWDGEYLNNLQTANSFGLNTKRLVKIENGKFSSKFAIKYCAFEFPKDQVWLVPIYEALHFLVNWRVQHTFENVLKSYVHSCQTHSHIEEYIECKTPYEEHIGLFKNFYKVICIFTK